jgi:hypothetical protein
MEWGPDAHDGMGWASVAENGSLRLNLLTDHEVLRQVEAVRATDLLRESDRLLCSLSPASAGGNAAFWSCLLRGIPFIYADETGARRAERWCGEYHPTLALGGAALAEGLAESFSERAAQEQGPVPSRQRGAWAGRDRQGAFGGLVALDGGARIRAFLTWTGSGQAIPEPLGQRLLSATGAVACPGLTDEFTGRLIAVSLPDPPLGSRTAEPQRGLRGGSPGRLLPGLDPTLVPTGWTMDADDFVFPTGHGTDPAAPSMPAVEEKRLPAKSE